MYVMYKQKIALHAYLLAHSIGHLIMTHFHHLILNNARYQIGK